MNAIINLHAHNTLRFGGLTGLVYTLLCTFYPLAVLAGGSFLFWACLPGPWSPVKLVLVLIFIVILLSYRPQLPHILNAENTAPKPEGRAE